MQIDISVANLREEIVWPTVGILAHKFVPATGWNLDDGVTGTRDMAFRRYLVKIGYNCSLDGHGHPLARVSMRSRIRFEE